jgi:nucleoside-diphosphate-sugar epimerase
MKDAILLTGARGFIGSNLNKALKGSYRVIQLISSRQASSEKDDRHALDLADSEQIDRFLETLEVKQYMAVIHLAALLCKPGEWDDIRYFDINNAITRNMIRLMRHIESECFLNFSTLGVYPNKTGIYDENSEVNMADNTECLYGLAKFNSEMLFAYYLKNQTKVINLRLTQVYGPGMQQDRLIGIMRKELESENSITLFGNGERISNFIHVDDVVGGVKAVIEKPVAGTFILGHHENYSYLEIAEHLIQKYGNPDSRRILKDKGFTCKCRYDTSRFRRVYNYTAKKLSL